MYQDKRILAILPARGGSKRVPKKNLRTLGDKPLIAWTINSAKSSKYIDDVFVTTDCEEIQACSMLYGANATPLRTKDLATDHSKTSDVILDVIKRFEEKFDILILLQPTSPFRNSEDIDSAIETFFRERPGALVSVCPTDAPTNWMFALDEKRSLNELVARIHDSRSQDFVEEYQLNGAIYICSFEFFKKHQNFYVKDESIAFPMSRLNSIDIDIEDDFLLAELVSQHFSS